MGEAAVLVAKFLDYLDGTVEFYWTNNISTLGDEYAFASGTSVTEWITGTDLVSCKSEWHRRRISNQAEDLKIKDMRCSVYAEDPMNDFA
jgi:acetyl/propionyl-CoA carboxylase alpha subunit